tara:strand:+ start:166 stop:630 length:465 start_codon:yes stop_codon:yes gene_type:complete
MKLTIILLTIYIFTIVQINALEKEVFMSTKFDKVNVRKGPGLKYDIIYQFLIVGVPLKIKKEFENWKMVEDYEGGIGWIAKSQLTNKRYGMTLKDECYVKLLPDNNVKNFLILKKKVIFNVLKCRKDWCKIEIQNKKGWIRKEDFWGSSADEIF